MPVLKSSRTIRPLVPASRVGDITQYKSTIDDWWLLALLAAHVPVVLLMKQSAAFARMMTLVPLACGLAAIAYGRRPTPVLYAAAYIAGTDVLNRMTKGAWFWEQSKYSLVLLMLIGFVKFTPVRKPDWPIVAYFMLLLPSAFMLVFDDWDFSWQSQARGAISFHLSGPLVLMATGLFCSVVTVTRAEFRNLLICAFMPLFGTCVLVFAGLGNIDEMAFKSGSNFATSGGFGPNQVSAILGLGFVSCFLLVTLFTTQMWEKLFYGVLGVWMLGQAVFTFSRGGVVSALLATIAGGVAQLTNRRLRGIVLGAGVSFALAGYAIFPILVGLTGGALEERFTDTGTTGRWELIVSDVEAWTENFLLGVGPGQSNAYHAEALGHTTTAHTEFSRLIAEHGLLGAMAGLSVALILIRNFFLAENSAGKSLVLCLGIWGTTMMLHASMRISAIAFTIGLTSLIIRDVRHYSPNIP